MKTRADTAVSYVILVAFAAFALIPLLLVVVLSLQPEGSTGFSFTSGMHFENYARAWTVGYFAEYLRSSLLVTIAVLVLVLPISSAAAYAFATMRFPGRDLLFSILLIGLVIPFEAAIIPLFGDLRSVGLDDTYWALILPQAALGMSFGVFWMRSFFLSVPQELIESARMDGARSFAVLRLVLVPMARPALLTQAVLSFMWSWNEFLLPLVMVSSNDKQTAPLGMLFFIKERTTDQTGLAAAAVLVALPVVIVFLVLQRSFIRGMFSGALR